MSTRQFMGPCKQCGKLTMHVGPSTSHVLHLLLSLITFGLWIPIWLLVAASNGRDGQCTECGRRRGILG